MPEHNLIIFPGKRKISTKNLPESTATRNANQIKKHMHSALGVEAVSQLGGKMYQMGRWRAMERLVKPAEV